MVFRPFYVQKEFLRKILSLPDFDFRDSDDTLTIILENIIRSSGTFFISGGYLRTVVPHGGPGGGNREKHCCNHTDKGYVDGRWMAL